MRNVVKWCDLSNAKGLDIKMEINIKDLQCDWYMGSVDFYEEAQITSELIEKIKDSIIRNEEDGPYNIYAAYDDANWLYMCFRKDLVSIQIICEPDHEYIYYDKKYEGKTGLELIEFDQNILPRIETCEDMVLAANIFKEWTMYGKLYSTTWADMNITPNIFDAYYHKEESEDLYSLSIYGIGESKSKTIVFLKKFFKDSDFKQTLKRIEQFPILLCVYFEHNISTIEKELKKIGADYRKEKVSEKEYEEFSYLNHGELWLCMMEYLHLR